MTGKQILLSALKGHATPRPAWVPLVGVHGGHLVGVSACAYLQSADLIVAGLTQAVESYAPDGLPVIFDPHMEAEVLGCELAWSDQTPPCVATHPLGNRLDPSVLLTFDVSMGRYPIVLEALDRLHARFSETIAFYGLITGPFTLATSLRGPSIFLDLFDDQRGLQDLMQFCADVAKQAANAYLAHGADVVAVVEPVTSQISPAHFEQFVAPHVNRVFEHVRARGALSSLLVRGDASRNLQAMCRTSCDNLSVDENVCLETLRDVARKHGKSFSGNLRVDAVLRTGNSDDARLDAIRCIDTGQCEGFTLSPGWDLPYAVPPRNLEAVRDMVHGEYERLAARTMITARSAVAFDNTKMPDYGDPMTVYVDVVTLDSAGCAPCQRMVAAARRSAEQAAARTVVREHKISSRQGIRMMLRLGVERVPTICIDGHVAFSADVPDIERLSQAIDRAACKDQRPT